MRQICSLEEMIGRVRAAVAAKSDPDFMIIARTDARLVYPFEESLRRARAFAEAGADMLYVEHLRSREELAEAARVLLIESAHDEAFSPTARAALRALYPQAQVRAFAGGSRAVTVTDPAEYIAAVRAFLEAPRVGQRDRGLMPRTASSARCAARGRWPLS